MSKHISNFYAIQAALDAVRNIKYAIANVRAGAYTYNMKQISNVEKNCSRL